MKNIKMKKVDGEGERGAKKVKYQVKLTNYTLITSKHSTHITTLAHCSTAS